MKGALLALFVLVVTAFAAPHLLGLFFVGAISGPNALSCRLALQPSAALVGGTLRLPVVGNYRVTSPYGPRVHPVTGQHRTHRGLDLSLSPHGGPVLAMTGGTVTSAGPAGDAGNRVVLNHGNGLVSKYLHLSRIDVVVGQSLQTGHQLGTEGATGRVTGPHLHWEVWIDGASTDPRLWAQAQGLVFDGNAPAVAQVGASAAQAAGGNLTVVPPTIPLQAGDLPAPVGRWDPEQVSNAAEIVAAGTALGLDQWTIAVGVMTAMGESTLLNVGHGDRVGPDSRGLFQQRANGAWGSEQDRMTPRLAATNFFRALLAVPAYHDLTPTMAAHRTQRNADPNHYAIYWPDAVLVVSTILADPTLLSRLAASGRQADCASAPVANAELPAAPGAECTARPATAEVGLHPSALRGLRCGTTAFPAIRTTHGVGARTGRSDHPRGLAVDFMIENYRTAEGNALGWQLAEWTRANAAQLNVRYIIWDMKYWSASRPDHGWVPYTRYGSNPDDNLAHRNHVHTSYNS